MNEELRKLQELFDIAWQLNEKAQTRAELSQKVTDYLPSVIQMLDSLNDERQYFCPKEETIVPTKIISKEETYVINGEPITLTVDVRICTNCGEEINDIELDSQSQLEFYVEYARKMKGKGEIR